DAELQTISDIVGHLPVFRDFDRDSLPALLNDCADLLNRENGLDQTLKAIREGLPAKLHETAYASACDVVASDGEATREEVPERELIRDRLHIERVVAVAIERASKARFQTV